MNRFAFAIVMILLVGLCLKATPAQEKRPNILYLYVDDMGWGSIGPNGQNDRKENGQPYVQTPNINRLAAQGLNFVRGYGCHVCSPARSSQQSGFHQGHTFADRNDPDNAKKAMRKDDILMGDALAAAGYTTGYWGKWGYGGSKSQENPVIENVQTLPTSHGYQHVLAELHHVRAHTFFQPTLWSAPAKPGAIGGMELVPNSLEKYSANERYPSGPALQNHANYPRTAYCDDAYAFAALDFVREQAIVYNETGKPFFGLFAAQIPHAPFGEISDLPEWDKAYADDRHFKSLKTQTQQWAAMVTRIDAHYGNILAALEDPNGDGDKSDSVADNTLVIFQSDNGGPGGPNNLELDANGGLSGVKGKIQEGGIRVPLVMRWPAKIGADSTMKSGTATDMVVDVTDLLPTFCDLAGAEKPLGLDGVSIAPTLTGKGHQRKREFIIHEAGNGQSIIRGNHKLVRSKQSPCKLYDLVSDAAEKNDIAKQNPELVKELEELLLGERVDEPRGFANTYHHWTGKDGGATLETTNWSDYEYANAGKTYMKETGAPTLSWTAVIDNTSVDSNTARAYKDLEFLGLAISSSGKGAGKQKLVLERGVNLTGRNEILVKRNATLEVNGGTVSSLRWLEIQPGGTLMGTGTILATLYNSGSLKLRSSFEVGSFYHEKSGTLEVEDSSARIYTSTASLEGRLSVNLANGVRPVTGKNYLFLMASEINGKFENENDEVVTDSGQKFEIVYTKRSVSLVAK